MTESLDEFYINGLYAWNYRTMRALSLSGSSKLAIVAVSHYSVAASVESSYDVVFEVFVEKNATRMKAAACFFDRQTYIRKEAWLTSFSGRKSHESVLQRFAGAWE